MATTEDTRSSESKRIERNTRTEKKGKSFSRQFSTSFQTNKRFLSFVSFLFFLFFVSFSLSSVSSLFINAFIFRDPASGWSERDTEFIHSAFGILFFSSFVFTSMALGSWNRVTQVRDDGNYKHFFLFISSHRVRFPHGLNGEQLTA